MHENTNADQVLRKQIGPEIRSIYFFGINSFTKNIVLLKNRITNNLTNEEKLLRGGKLDSDSRIIVLSLLQMRNVARHWCQSDATIVYEGLVCMAIAYRINI